MSERKYSLRTCLLVMLGGIVASWAVVLGIGWALWAMMPGAGGFSPDLPPERYRGDAKVQVRFTSHAEPLCNIIKAKRGSIACAPVGGDLIIAPNPCGWRDPYAKLMCHELGHSMGWGAEHPR